MKIDLTSRTSLAEFIAQYGVRPLVTSTDAAVTSQRRRPLKSPSERAHAIIDDEFTADREGTFI
jgi:hypothetical protein